MIYFNKKNFRMWSMLGGSGTFGVVASEIAKADDKFVVLTADLTYFSGLERLRNQTPTALYNMGIAEQNMIGAAAGMAKEGFNVFATTYAAFATTRCMDQVKVNMGYMKLPVKLIGLTAGFASGILGPTHMALEDIAIMRAIPNMTILSPADCVETAKAVLASYEFNGPVYIRLTGEPNSSNVYSNDYDFTIGKAVTMNEGDDIAIIATGSMVYESLEAAKILSEKGICCKVINFHTIKPLDKEVLNNIKNIKLIVTVEEHSKIGGLGSAISEYYSDKRHNHKQLIIGVLDQYPQAANYRSLLETCELTSEKIAQKISLYYENL